MKLGNGMGGISKAPGNRRRPYCARVTTGWIYDEEGKRKKQIQKVVGYYRTKKEALEALVDYNRDPYDLDSLKVTFDECYQNLTFTESTMRAYQNAYRYLAPVQNKPIKTIKPAELQDCVNACQNSQQPLVKTICRRTYKYAFMNGYIEKDISQYIEARTQEVKIEREIFTHDQIEELWTMTRSWWVKVTLILLYSGMRTKELRTIDLDMINFKDRWLDITMAKNKFSVRGLPIHERIVPFLEDYMINGGNLYGYSHAALNKALNEFHGHRAHDARHTFTTRMRECGVDHLTVQRLLGHTPTDITYKTYTHISHEELAEAISKLIY